jgi:hypothetical protein
MHLLRDIAAIALAFFHFRLRFVSAIDRERSAKVYLFFEFALAIPANITF